MRSTESKYRFNIRTWLMQLPATRRTQLLDKVTERSGQSKVTIRRIIYMKADCSSYVRHETKEAFCEVFRKKISELENKEAA